MPQPPGTPPPILSIAGSDCSAGAGVQADLKAISALGGFGLTALTSVVSETPGKVSMIRLLEADIIRDQVSVLLEGFPVKAAKTGMVGGVDQVVAVAEAWRTAGSGIPLVVDPVMVATSGGRLLQDEAVEVLCRELFPQAALLTPNMDEAGVLWGRTVQTRAEMQACAHDLAQRFQTSLLVKGGHLAGDAAADVLYTPHGTFWLETERTPGVQTHGTGCTFSAAIATGLGHGLGLAEAVSNAKKHVARAIAQHFSWTHRSGTVHALNHLSQS